MSPLWPTQQHGHSRLGLCNVNVAFCQHTQGQGCPPFLKEWNGHRTCALHEAKCTHTQAGTRKSTAALFLTARKYQQPKTQTDEHTDRKCSGHTTEGSMAMKRRSPGTCSDLPGPQNHYAVGKSDARGLRLPDFISETSRTSTEAEGRSAVLRGRER